MRLLFALAAAGTLAASAAAAQERPVGPAVRDELAVTVYGGGFGLVKDRRTVTLDKGRNLLAFEGVPPRLQPESAMLRPAGAADPLPVLRQVFDRDLLSPQTLLAESVGQEVWVVRVNPATGEEVRRRGRLLSARDGAVVEIDGRVEAVDPANLAFDAVPAGVRRQPMLVFEVEAAAAGPHQVELVYLTEGLDWRADYVAELAADRQRMDLAGRVSVANDSGAAYPNAALRFVAGEVGRVPPPTPAPEAAMRTMARADVAGTAPGVAEQALAGSRLYRLDRPATLEKGQTAQFALLQGQDVPVRREHWTTAQPHIFHAPIPEPEEVPANLDLVFRNVEASHLGMPLPAGVFRVYERDAQGELQLLGEDSIEHSAPGAEVRVGLGRDVDVPARRVQTAFQRLSDRVTESAYAITLRNAKDEAVTVLVKEPIPGDWQILEESLPHRKETAHLAVWEVPVPAGGETVLRYRVRIGG